MYNQKELRDLESIVAGIYYLSEESYRCGLKQVGLVLRASIAFIEGDKKESDNATDSLSESCSKNGLLDLMDLLDAMKRLPVSKRNEILDLLQNETLDNMH